MINGLLQAAYIVSKDISAERDRLDQLKQLLELEADFTDDQEVPIKVLRRTANNRSSTPLWRSDSPSYFSRLDAVQTSPT